MGVPSEPWEQEQAHEREFDVLGRGGYGQGTRPDASVQSYAADLVVAWGPQVLAPFILSVLLVCNPFAL